ncbi:MAG: HD domain-containing phosphohydrolase [Burkholderiales bacterium]
MTTAADRIPLPQVRDLLQIGQALPFRVLDEHERLLLNEGHVLIDEAQFESLVGRGAWAERSMVEAARVAQAAAAARSAAIKPPLSLFDRWERLLWQFDKLTRSVVRREEPGSAVPLFFEALQTLVDRDADVALFLCVRQDNRRFALYALTHAMNCAVVVLLTGRQLGWPAARITSLGCAALTMNLSILELQATMAEQGTPPTKKQLDQIRAHPVATVALLRAAGVADDDWLTAVVEHHEQPGGAGYPHALTELGELAQVLRAADVYMAKISPRANRPPMATQMATRQLFQQRPGDPLAMAMIKTLGIHPPGSLVQLQSGEVGVAIRRPATGTHPLVATLSDKKGKPSGETHRRDTAQAEFAVVGPLQDAKAFPRVLPERVYGMIDV